MCLHVDLRHVDLRHVDLRHNCLLVFVFVFLFLLGLLLQYNPRMTAVLQPRKKEFERPPKIEYICFVMYIISIIRPV